MNRIGIYSLAFVTIDPRDPKDVILYEKLDIITILFIEIIIHFIGILFIGMSDTYECLCPDVGESFPPLSLNAE